MALKKNMEVSDWIELFLRRKWFIIFSFLIITFGAFAYCVVAPEYYTSSTTILIIPQKIPEDYVKSTVTYQIEARLNTLKQQILSRTRL
ncbi:MAG: lipopolysaccharide biosynthesis protein, partial [Deltaproteobacteria bacterium]